MDGSAHLSPSDVTVETLSPVCWSLCVFSESLSAPVCVRVVHVHARVHVCTLQHSSYRSVPLSSGAL